MCFLCLWIRNWKIYFQMNTKKIVRSTVVNALTSITMNTVYISEILLSLFRISYHFYISDSDEMSLFSSGSSSTDSSDVDSDDDINYYRYGGGKQYTIECTRATVYQNKSNQKIRTVKPINALEIINCHFLGRAKKFCNCLSVMCPNNGANQTAMVQLIESVRAYVDDIRPNKREFESFMIDNIKGISIVIFVWLIIFIFYFVTLLILQQLLFEGMMNPRGTGNKFEYLYCIGQHVKPPTIPRKIQVCVNAFKEVYGLTSYEMHKYQQQIKQV